MATKEANYFDLFIEGAGICQKAAIQLKNVVKDNIDTLAEIKAIHDIEHEGDELHHRVYTHLNRSFITPIEREDIMSLAGYIEETIDMIDEVAIMFNMLSVTKVREEGKQMVELIVKASDALLKATIEFKNFKKSKTLSELIVLINHIEEEADVLYQNSVKTLFSKETDPMEVIRWKNIFDTLENVLDSTENVADIMEGVMIKNS